MLKFFENIFSPVAQTLENGFLYLTIIVCVGIIIAIIVFSLSKIDDVKNQFLSFCAIILCCFFVIPAYVSVEKVFRKKAIQFALDESNKEIAIAKSQEKNLRLENEKLALQNETEKLEIDKRALTEGLELMKKSQAQFIASQDIMELALSENQIQQNQVWKYPIEDTQDEFSLINDKKSQTEFLGVANFDITAKFGIDLKEVKIKKIDANTIHITNVKPKYIGASDNQTNKVIAEIRKTTYINGNVDKIEILNNRDKIILANENFESNVRDYQKSLKDMTEFNFIKETVVKLGEKYIEIIFSPIYKNIEFVNSEDNDFLFIEDFFNEQISIEDEKSKNLLQVQDEINTKLATYPENGINTGSFVED